MKTYGVPFYFYAHVDVQADSEDEAREIAESLCLQVSAKLDGYKPQDVFFEEIGEPVEVE